MTTRYLKLLEEEEGGGGGGGERGREREILHALYLPPLLPASAE